MRFVASAGLLGVVLGAAVAVSACNVVVEPDSTGSSTMPSSTIIQAATPDATQAPTSEPSSEPTQTPTSAPSAEPTPAPTSDPSYVSALTPSCLLAPSNGKDTRIEVTGSDSDAACASLVSVLGSSNWEIVGSSNGEFGFIIPDADSSTLCVGTVGSSTFKVLDHEFVNGTGDAACSQLQTAYP